MFYDFLITDISWKIIRNCFKTLKKESALKRLHGTRNIFSAHAKKLRFSTWEKNQEQNIKIPVFNYYTTINIIFWFICWYYNYIARATAKRRRERRRRCAVPRAHQTTNGLAAYSCPQIRGLMYCYEMRVCVCICRRGSC